MTKTANLETIEKATKKTWEEWLAFFKKIDAPKLSHKEIAQKVYDEIGDGWWAQGVTVAYEQHIGRRQPGQRSDGTYEVGANKTLNGTMDEAFAAWLKLVADKKEFNGVALEGAPTTNTTEKWRYWHAKLSDGTRLTVALNQKTPEKASFSIGHLKLASSTAAEKWRAFWKEFIEKL